MNFAVSRRWQAGSPMAAPFRSCRLLVIVRPILSVVTCSFPTHDHETKLTYEPVTCNDVLTPPLLWQQRLKHREINQSSID